MKKQLLTSLVLLSAKLVLAQNVAYDLKVIAEGNFGTPNGDVFNVTITNTAPTTQSGPLYQTANSTTGFDVLQDFQIVGNKAILLSKSTGFRVVIADYPELTHIATFTNVGAPQTIVKASNTLAYISVGNSNAIRKVDMINNTISLVSDPSSYISGVSKYMIAANGFVYAALGSVIAKIDTITSAVTATINPGLGSITGLEYDIVNQQAWILGKTGGVSTVVKMEVTNNDFLNSPIVLTSITNAAYLRFCNNKLYFLSGKNVHAYNITSPNIPTTAIYTSTLSGSWDFAYGKSFFVEQSTGNFVLGSANGFVGASLYEIIDGASLQVVASGSVTGCMGVNEFILNTYTVGIPTNTKDVDTDNLVYSVFPNPANDVVKINVSNTTNSEFILIIMNQLGEKVFQHQFTGTETGLDLKDFNSGIYYLSIEQKGRVKSLTQKIIITH